MTLREGGAVPPRIFLLWWWDTAKSFFRGERGMLATFAFGYCVLMVPGFIMHRAIPSGLDWTVSYRRVMWAYAIGAPLAWTCATLYATMLTRSLMRAWRSASHRIIALAFYAIVITAAPFIAVAYYDKEMLQYWWASLRGTHQPMTIYADPYLGRVVARGSIEFGSAEALQRVLDKNQRYSLIELDSPGGFVMEGFRMASMVAARKMDTVVIDECASACTLILVVGQDRYLAPNAQVGFHRSGRKHLFEDHGWSETDHRMAAHYNRYGATPEFVAHALEEPMFGIWWAPHADMYRDGYANKAWSERKPGY